MAAQDRFRPSEVGAGLRRSAHRGPYCVGQARMNKMTIGSADHPLERGQRIGRAHRISALPGEPTQPFAGEGFVLPQAPLDQAHRPASDIELAANASSKQQAVQ